MKRIICIICAFAVTAALAGCTAAKPAETAEAAVSETSAPEVSQEPEQTVAETPASTPEVSEEPEQTEAPASTPEVSEEPEQTAAEMTADTAAGAPDISSAIDASTTTDTAAAPVGQWVKTAMYATEDDTYHTVYVRVTKITTQTDGADYVQSAIDLNNQNSPDYNQIDTSTLNLPSDVELCVLDYDVYVPAEFPSPDYGITEPTMYFSESNIGGGGIPSADGSTSYIGLGSNTTDLAAESDPTYQPGNTYSFKCLFTMVKGYTDYVIDFTSYPDGTKEVSGDVMYYGYFANK